MIFWALTIVNFSFSVLTETTFMTFLTSAFADIPFIKKLVMSSTFFADSATFLASKFLSAFYNFENHDLCFHVLECLNTFSLIGGSTMLLSRHFITILQSCFRSLFRTDLSQFSAYIEREPALKVNVNEEHSAVKSFTIEKIHQWS